MSQAIVTKTLSPTNTRGARIKATCGRGELTVAWKSELSVEENHVRARNALIDQFAKEDYKLYGTLLMRNPWLRKWYTGTIKDGSHVHVQPY